MEKWIDVFLVVLVTAGVLILLYVAARSKGRRTASSSSADDARARSKRKRRGSDGGENYSWRDFFRDEFARQRTESLRNIEKSLRRGKRR